jgi:hypothetical protein
MLKRFLLAALLVLAGFAVGRAMPRPSAPSVATAVTESAASPAAVARTERACKNDLVNAKAQLAICLAFHGSPEPSSSTSPPASTPPLDTDEETAELVRAHRTNTETVLVQQAEGGLRTYAAGGWPPAGGPPPGARIIARRVDGGTMMVLHGGGTDFVPFAAGSTLCPCPRDAGP